VKLTYEVVKLSFELNEINLAKRVLYSASRLWNRQWEVVSSEVMVPEEILGDKDKKGKKDTKKKEESGLPE